MEWSDKLSVGIEEIDEQHRELINRVNQFYTAIKANRSKAEALDILQYLSSYVVVHFADEERLQVRSAYPGYAEHKKMHAEFIQTVKQLTAEVQQDGVGMMTFATIATTLSNWLVSHISQQDRKIGLWIQNRAS
jgi:hemerythrin